MSGSALVGGSQLAQDRTAATGRGAGLYPGQLLTAPLAAYLRQLGVRARIEEYFLDNRVGNPDPNPDPDSNPNPSPNLAPTPTPTPTPNPHLYCGGPERSGLDW